MKTMDVLGFTGEDLENPVTGVAHRRAENDDIINALVEVLPISIAVEGYGLRTIMRREPAPDLGEWAFRCRMTPERKLIAEMYLTGPNDAVFMDADETLLPAAYVEVEIQAGGRPIIGFGCDPVRRLPLGLREQGVREAYHLAQAIGWAYSEMDGMQPAPKEIQ